MTSIIDPLPTPKQIERGPERVILHALGHAIELTLRALAAVHPELGQRAERPYWTSEPSRPEIVAERIVVAAEELEKCIRGYLMALEIDRGDPLEDDLPF
jgi:hypothetical protein